MDTAALSAVIINIVRLNPERYTNAINVIFKLRDIRYSFFLFQTSTNRMVSCHLLYNARKERYLSA